MRLNRLCFAQAKQIVITAIARLPHAFGDANRDAGIGAAQISGHLARDLFGVLDRQAGALQIVRQVILQHHQGKRLGNDLFRQRKQVVLVLAHVIAAHLFGDGVNMLDAEPVLDRQFVVVVAFEVVPDRLVLVVQRAFVAGWHVQILFAEVEEQAFEQRPGTSQGGFFRVMGAHPIKGVRFQIPQNAIGRDHV